MHLILYGLQVTVIGMLVVFAGLLILILFIQLMERGFAGSHKKQPPASPPNQGPAAPVRAQSAAAVPAQPPVAVIAAAVAAFLGQQADQQRGGFTVRAVRRVYTAPPWQRAGREEQIYGRM
ncbi:MAG: OadG family protein [Oscillospiraceae bacterium]|nr:OadG family protein [Oscillospiraceae bacterium]